MLTFELVNFINIENRHAIDSAQIFSDDESYVYRVDLTRSSLGLIENTTGKDGHSYISNVDNLEIFRYSGRHELDEMFTEIDRINDTSTARGLYFFRCFNAARYFQLTRIRAAIDVNMNEARKLTFSFNSDDVKQFGIISRVPISCLPPGRFFEDPKQDATPFGYLHLIDPDSSNPERIFIHNIDFWFDRQWVNGLNVPFSEIETRLLAHGADFIVPHIMLEFIK